nr:metallophosphoesterase [uncultured Cohaesibacter sp.]
MQKIIHLTDPHLVASGQRLFGLDPAQRLKDTLTHISAHHADAAAILITGDLAKNGDFSAYELLRDMLQDVKIPVHLTVGNHDNRERFHQIFGGEGFVQASIDLEDWRIVLMDSKDETSDCGCLDGGRLEWLEAQLEGAEGRPVVLAMHHTPGNLHMPRFSVSDLKDADQFLALLTRHKNIRHMLFGHRHVAATGTVANIPFTCSRGTSYHIVLEIGRTGKPDFTAAAPSYDCVILEPDTVTIHHFDGIDALPVICPGDPE